MAVFGLQGPENFNLSKAGLALDGYDVVTYFTKSEPSKGKKEIKVQRDGVTYLFASEENKKKFQANPENYNVAYGGWCAYAIGETGEKVKVDPETYKIIEDRLYLFYNFWGNNTLKEWNKRETELKSSADNNWLNILKSNE